MAANSRLTRAKTSGRRKLKKKIELKSAFDRAQKKSLSASERALIESEKKYRELVELAHEGITTVNKDDNLTFVNRQFARSIGYTVDELIGKNIRSLVSKESRKKIEEETHKRKDGKKSRYEVALLHKDGSKKYFWLSASPIYDEDDEYSGSMGVYSDMTEKKVIELNLEKRAKQINTLYKVYSHARMARPFTSVLNGIVTEIVNAFPFGEHVQSSITFDGKLYSHPKKLKRFMRKIEVPLIISGVKRGVLRVGYNKKIAEGFPTLKEERELTKNVAKILCKHINAREINGRHREIITKAFTALVIVHKGKIKYANPRFYSMFRSKESETMDKPITKFLPGCSTEAKNVDGRVRECFGKRAGVWDLELAVTMLNINYHGKPSILLRINDITALKQAQAKLKNFNQELRIQVKEKTHHLEEANKRLQSLNDLKDEFIAITSHELRSPLTSIRGYLSFLVEDETLEQFDDPYREYLMRAYSTTDALNYLINNILDASRLDMGRFELQLQEGDIIKLTKSIVDSLSFQACENKLVIEFKNETGGPELYLPFDFIRISQVLRNIIDNSIKFTKQGKKIFVSITKGAGRVRITVADQGVGIPQAKLEQVFDKFMQVKNINTKYRGGVGLGLFISKRIVELHDGKIEAEQNDHGGTTISIDLPLKSKHYGKRK